MSTNKLRSVVDIIKEILLIIPDSEPNFKKEIEDYIESLWNKAPEILYTNETWFPLQVILSKNIFPFDKEWKFKVLQIFNGVE